MRDSEELAEDVTENLIESNGGDAEKALQELKKMEEQMVEDSDIFDSAEEFENAMAILNHAARVLMTIGKEGVREVHQHQIDCIHQLGIDNMEEIQSDEGNHSIEAAEKKAEALMQAADYLEQVGEDE